MQSRAGLGFDRSATAFIAERGWLRALHLVLVMTCLFHQVGCKVLRSRDTRVFSSARELSLRGADALQQRKYTDAESLFVEALRLSPNDERAHWGFSEVLWTQGAQKQATSHMAQAVVLSGSNPDLLIRLGQMYLEQEDYAHAEEQADETLRTHRNNPAAWALKADVLRCRGELEESIDTYQRALVYRPDWPEVQVTLAELYRLTGRPQRALATLDRLTDQRSETQVPPRAFLLRGQALADLGERDAAMMCLRRTTPKLANDQSGLLVEFAKTQSELGDIVDARLCLGRALQHDPTNSLALQLQTELDQKLALHNEPNVPAIMVATPVPQ